MTGQEEGGGSFKKKDHTLESDFTLEAGQEDVVCVDLEGEWSEQSKIFLHPSFKNPNVKFLSGEVYLFIYLLKGHNYKHNKGENITRPFLRELTRDREGGDATHQHTTGRTSDTTKAPSQHPGQQRGDRRAPEGGRK